MRFLALRPFKTADNLVALHFKYDQARRRFVEWAQNEIAVVPDFHKRILFSDETHFWLNGYVNEQNCRIWSEANPQVYVETPLHPEKMTVWCALWAGGIIGPYFFKNDEGHNVTVNGDRYRAMITNFFIPELNNHDVQELWFQQDGATCHTACATIDLLKDTFGDRLISRFRPVNWPPRSCDLTPLDYFLWGYVKSLVYADKPQTLDHLETKYSYTVSSSQLNENYYRAVKAIRTLVNDDEGRLNITNTTGDKRMVGVKVYYSTFQVDKDSEVASYSPKYPLLPYVHMERTSYLPFNAREIDNYGGGGLMVWVGIMLDGRTPLHVFERDSVTGVRYRD
ncbi:uncharacterized protein TNCV_2152461 [Trichonephila clavipes]|nr:uncharacterized protein TNCV_2152461 [Trichonephila clavipes]